MNRLTIFFLIFVFVISTAIIKNSSKKRKRTRVTLVSQQNYKRWNDFPVLKSTSVLFFDLEKKHFGKFHDATSFTNAKLVDFLQEIIERKIIIVPEIINGKWCEIDTIQDLEIAKTMFKD